MPLPDDRDAFEAAFRDAVAVVLPSSAVERVDRTIVAIKLRVDVDEHRYIDVFFNSRNQRVISGRSCERFGVPRWSCAAAIRERAEPGSAILASWL